MYNIRHGRPGACDALQDAAGDLRQAGVLCTSVTNGGVNFSTAWTMAFSNNSAGETAEDVCG